jgi:hypothetical protein
MIKNCLVCGKEFECTEKGRYCSNKCSCKGWYQNNKEKAKEYSTMWRQKYPDRRHEIVRKSRQKNFNHHKEYSKFYRDHNKERVAAWGLSTRQKRRHIVLEHYSGGDPKCSCCGESTYEFLCIDHINGGGNKHRREIGYPYKSFYQWLINNGLPIGFRVLCQNCNFSLGHYGYCPHHPEISQIKTGLGTGRRING